MELTLIRSLMNKEFYDEHKGSKCPNRLFSKDVRKIKQSIDESMEKFNRTMTPDEIEAYFISTNPTLTTAQNENYAKLFKNIKSEKPMGNDVASDVLSRLFQQVVGEDIANLGFDYVNGMQSTLEPLRGILDKYGDDFTPNMNLDWHDASMDSVLSNLKLKYKWKFNIPTLAKRIPGVNAGHFAIVGARPNTGKTSFLASLIAAPNGFAHQGAKCVLLVNEETADRVLERYITSASGYTTDEQYKLTHPYVYDDYEKVKSLYNRVHGNIKIMETHDKQMPYVETVCKIEKPDVLIVDVGDKFASMQGFVRQDESLKANVIHARQIAKVYNCVVFYVSQLSTEAEGKVVLNQSMLEGSKTGKAAEADLILLLARNPHVQGQFEEDKQRHINIAKNKLTGWHGVLHCNLDYVTGRYYA